MNQILVTKDNKDTSSKDIKPIVKLFCIACIIFAIVLGIEGGVKLYKKIGKSSNFDRPEVFTEQSGSTVILRVTSKKRINKVVYSWNGGAESTLDGEGKQDINFQIEMPQGENKLNAYIIDVDGNKTILEEMTFKFDSSIDTVKPVITLENVNGKLSVTAQDETELDYLTYKWEDGEEVKVQPEEDNKKVINQSIDVKKGTAKITIQAVDKSGNIQSVTKKIIGSDGPKIDVKLSNGNFIITVTDDFKITKIEYTLNDEVVEIKDLPKDAKEYQFTVPVKPDVDNYLKINAYEDSIMTEVKKKKSK